MTIKHTELLVLMPPLIFIGILELVGGTIRADDRPGAAAVRTSAANADEQAIRKTAEAFEAAYRAKDANAIAAGFAPEGEIVDAEGHAVRGRAAIGEEFRRMFQEQPEARMSLAITSIRIVAPGVAIEDGTTKLVRGGNEPAIHSRYAAVHVKLDGRWLVASTRDLVPNTDVISISERLKPLEFLIGDWIDESEEAVIDVVSLGRGTEVPDARVHRQTGRFARLEGDPAHRLGSSASHDHVVDIRFEGRTRRSDLDLGPRSLAHQAAGCECSRRGQQRNSLSHPPGP